MWIMQNFNNVVTFTAIGVFAITGVLAGLRKEADIFSLLVFGLVTALGGGTIRDVILNIPVFWVEDLNYIWIAAGSALLAFFVYHLFFQAQNLLLYLDAIGVALFTIQAIDKVLMLGYAPLIALIMGIITGTGGGLVRDVMTDRPTLFMTKDLYATPILLGGFVYLALQYLAPGSNYASFVAMLIIFGLRAAAIYWDLSMPGWLTARSES
jgi:uncharacterized membrane protein YeiH